MGGEAPKPASAPRGAVFLSYASQDAAAAKRICDALRAAGIEVWFDQSELRGGDAWDRSIREQIHDCRLFVPVISAQSDARPEGYFRREWKLAVDRTHDMSERVAFLVPVVIDDTSDSHADVPDRFREVQWTRLPAGETPSAFVERVQRLLSGEASAKIRPSAPPKQQSALSSRSIRMLAAVAAVLIAAVAYLVIYRPWIAKQPVAAPATASAIPAAFSPPPHSIAVLPFVNMSGDKEQEYFSDGVTEELITALSQARALKVIARTSSFAFKGRGVDVGTIARTLNVGSILEGSVRRAGSKVRVTVQLIDARNEFHVWSQEYDRDLKNILAMQSDIAAAVATQLEVRLLGDEAARVEAGGTENSAAYDAYLRSRELAWLPGEVNQRLALLETAVRLDPHFARAWIQLSEVYIKKYFDTAGAVAQGSMSRSRGAAERAVQLAPTLAAAHTALAFASAAQLDWVTAQREVAAAEAINPADNSSLWARGNLDFQLGRFETAATAARAALEVDPLDVASFNVLAACLSAMGQHREAELMYRRALVLAPRQTGLHQVVAEELLFDHRSRDALAEIQLEPDKQSQDSVLPLIYFALGRQEEADRAEAAYERAHAADDALGIAFNRAYRGETDLAFEWLKRAVDTHQSGLFVIKGSIGTLPNIRNDPRYPELLKKIGLPVS